MIMAPRKTTAKAVEEKAVKAADTAVETKKATRKPAVKSTVYVQFAGREITDKDIVAACKKVFTDLAEGEDLKTLEIYVKPEECAAYFVANGTASDNYRVEL